MGCGFGVFGGAGAATPRPGFGHENSGDDRRYRAWGDGLDLTLEAERK